MNIKSTLVAACAIVFSTTAIAQDRLPTIAPEKYSDEQKKAAE